MANVRTLQRSFSGGEMSPEMYGRIDDPKYQSGASVLRNFYSVPQGPAENRPGFEFVREVKDSTKKTRLIPFTFNTIQTMVIELGAGYLRFHTQAATLQTPAAAAFQPGLPVDIVISKTATVTMTIATPGVITWTAHGLVAGTRVQFSTTGALPTGITAGTIYYVLSPAANTFQISATPGGAAIATTGTQSGVHTAARPTIIERGGHGLTNGMKVGFTTTGALPTGMTADTVYYVKDAATNDFTIAVNTVATALITSGTQSGIQNADSPYELGDLVTEGGTTYYCKQTAIDKLPSANPTYWYPITSDAYEIPNPYAEEDLFDIHYVQSADIITLVHPNYQPREIRRYGATKWTLEEVVFGSPLAAPTNITVTKYVPASAAINVDTYQPVKYVVTALTDDLTKVSGPSPEGSVTTNIYVTGAYNTISWSAVAGAERYYVYKYQGGTYGYIGNTTTTSLIDDNIGPDMGITPPIYPGIFGSPGNYPGAVSYFEQRKCFAGSVNEPQKIWMTKSGTENNMSYSVPTRDDDRIEFRVAAREANTIRHIVPLTQLLLLTGAAEWRVTSVNSDAITPSTISVRPQSYIGASNVQPVIINNSLVYGASRGGHIRECGYNWQANGFVTNDLSLRAAHLFDNYEVVDMAYAKAPHPIIWFISTSGDLLGLTFVPEQQIGAWHHHDTDGSFETCTTVAEGSDDALYVIAKREINGVEKRYIERMRSRKFDSIEDCFFVDSGLTYDGYNTTSKTMTVSGGTTWGPADSLTITASSASFNYPSTSDVGDAIVFSDGNGGIYRCRIISTSSTTVASVKVDKTLSAPLRNTASTNWSFARNTISGLGHLEGKTVNILADGAVHPQLVVTSGSITLARAASKIHIGLPIVADMKTLPLALQVDAGFGQGRYKNINKAWLRVFNSSGIFIGPDEDNLVEAKQRTTEPYGSPPALKSQEIQVMLSPSWADSGLVFVRQKDPLPLTIIGLTMEVAVGG